MRLKIALAVIAIGLLSSAAQAGPLMRHIRAKHQAGITVSAGAPMTGQVVFSNMTAAANLGGFAGVQTLTGASGSGTMQFTPDQSVISAGSSGCASGSCSNGSC